MSINIEEIAERAKFGRSMPNDVPDLIAELAKRTKERDTAREFILCSEAFLTGTHAKLAKRYLDEWYPGAPKAVPE